MAAYVYAKEQLHLCFYVLIRYFVVLDYSHLKIMLKQLISTSGSVNIGEYSP